MKYTCIIVSLLCCTAGYVNAQTANSTIQRGNELYKKQQYDQAEAAYREVLTMEQGNTTAAFNRANALYRQAKPAEAIKLLDELMLHTNDPALKAKAYYNKGVMLSGQQKLEESIEAYKNALRQDPADKEARENLQKALLELKKKNPPPPKENKDKKQQQQKNQQQQPKMNQKEAEQRLKLLEQKEKELQQRMQKEKAKTGGGQGKDW